MNRTFDRWGGFFFLVLGAAIVWQSFGISQSVSGSVVGPRTFPVGLGALLMLFSLRLIYETFTSPKYAESGAEAVQLDLVKVMEKGYNVIADHLVQSQVHLRHNAQKLSRHIERLVGRWMSRKR